MAAPINHWRGIPNKHELLDDYAVIIVTQKSGRQHVCRLDFEDFERLKHLHFNVVKTSDNFYAVATIDGHQRYMQRLVFKYGGIILEDGGLMVIHHTADAIDSLDNRKSVLRHLRNSEHIAHHNKKRAQARKQAQLLEAA